MRLLSPGTIRQRVVIVRSSHLKRWQGAWSNRATAKRFSPTGVTSTRERQASGDRSNASYSRHLFRLPTTGLRFFTVYGPWGRPDMALFLFTRAILEGRPIDVFNHGNMVRDFTYIDDSVEGVVRVMDRAAEANPAFEPARPDPGTSNAPYRVFNIGNSRPTPLAEYIEALEDALGRKAQRNYLPMQPGDVPATSANTDELDAWVGFKPNTPVREGVRRFVEWYRRFYGT